MALVNISEMLARRAVVVPSGSDQSDFRTGRDEYTVDGGELKTRLSNEASDRLYYDQDSLTVKRVAPHTIVEGRVNRSKVHDIMKDALNQRKNKLDALVAQVTEEPFIRIMKNIDDEHNMFFVRGALKRAICDMLMLMIDDHGAREAFKVAKVQVATSTPMFQAMIKALVLDEKKMKLTVQFVAKR